MFNAHCFMMIFGFNLHSTGLFGNVVLQFVYFSAWPENGGVQTMFLHGDFSRFSRTLEVNNLLSVDFQTQVFI